MDPRPALFPARLVSPDGVVTDPVRVATDTAGITRAWAWDPATSTIVVAGEWAATDLVPDDGPSRRPRGYTLPDGGRLTATRGCGCGHPLKAFRPRLVAEQPA